jgi:hypothetical protein
MPPTRRVHTVYWMLEWTVFLCSEYEYDHTTCKVLVLVPVLVRSGQRNGYRSYCKSSYHLRTQAVCQHSKKILVPKGFLRKNKKVKFRPCPVACIQDD